MPKNPFSSKAFNYSQSGKFTVAARLKAQKLMDDMRSNAEALRLKKARDEDAVAAGHTRRDP